MIDQSETIPHYGGRGLTNSLRHFALTLTLTLTLTAGLYFDLWTKK